MRTPHRFLEVQDLGAAVPYAVGMEKMREAIDRLTHDDIAEAGTLFLLEHADVITVTRSGGTTHLHVSEAALKNYNIALVVTDRGGDATFHGAGQVVGYPVVRLGPGKGLRVDLLGYLRRLEDAMCSVATTFGVRGVHRKEGMTGVWVASDPDASPDSWPDDDSARKLVAIGVGVGRGVTRHGFALNFTTDLERFTSRMMPCGLVGRPVTSLARELGHAPSIDDVKAACADAVAHALGLTLLPFDSLGSDAPGTAAARSENRRANALSDDTPTPTALA